MSAVPPCSQCGRPHPAGAPCASATQQMGVVQPRAVPETIDAPAIPAAGSAATAVAPLPVSETVYAPKPQQVPVTPAGNLPFKISETMAGPQVTRPPSEPDRPPPQHSGTGPEALVGQMVGSFKLVKLLGKGGMGAVYLGEHPGIGSRVAIKLLHPFLASRPDLVKRFYDEARAVNLIGHENIVSIFDLNQVPPDRYFIVMEYLEGQTLAQQLAATRVTLEEATDILLQLCDALAAAHDRRVVHRDLKPDNVFMTTRGTRKHFVKLVDFGIAKLRDEATSTSSTATGVLMGTPEYMSPEQADNNPVDARSDIYALGCIAFRLVTGRLPFEEKTLGKLIVSHLEKPPPPPRQFNPLLPEAYEKAILRSLEKKPEDRFQDMRAFADALRDAMVAPRTAPTAPTPPVAPPVAKAEQPRVVADFEVEVLAPPPAVRLRAGDVSRGGLFLRSAAMLPPLFSRVRLGLPGTDGRLVEVQGEVVRHVSIAEARAWSMEPGFGVQFIDLPTEGRALLAELTSRTAEAAPARPVPPSAPAQPEVASLLEYLSARFNANHYDLLGLPPDVELKAVLPASKVLDERIRRAMEKAAPEHRGPLQAGLERVRAATEVLANLARRVDYDAHRGNFRGVLRCVEAGLSVDDLNARRRGFLAQRPGLEVRTQQQLGRVRVARNRGNLPAALRELEAALIQDPLSVDLQRQYVEIQKLSKGAAPGK